MRRRHRRQGRTLPFALLACCLAAPLGAATFSPPERSWRTLESPHFQAHFPAGLDDQAARALAVAETVRQGVEAAFDWRPRGRTRLLITDYSDEANGYATPLPRNRIVLHLARPDDVIGLEDFADWRRLLLTHEYVHTVHLDKALDFPRDLRRLLGRHPLLFPNLYQPRWIIEGLATLHEDRGQPGHGRPGSSYFRALLRMEALGGLKSWRQVNQPVRAWPGGQTPYLYGLAVMDHLRHRLGETALRRLVDRTSGQPLPFLVALDFAPALGADLATLWQSFDAAVSARAQAEAAAVRARGEVSGVAVTDWGYTTGQPLPDGEALWLIRDDGVRPLTLVRRDGQGTHEIAWVYGRARLDHHPGAGLLVSQMNRVDNVQSFHDLYRLPPGATTLQRLTHGGRYRQAAWSPDGRHIAAVREDAGRSEIHLLDRRGRLQRVLWRGGETVVAGLDWDPAGGALVAAIWRPDAGQWDLARLSLAGGSWRLLTDDRATQAHPRFAPDGALLYSADHDGIYDIYRIPPEGGWRERLTRVVGGAFQPAMDAQGGLYYTGLTPAGQQVFHLSRPRPLERAPLPPPRPWSEPSPAPPPDFGPSRPYRPQLRPSFWLPLWDLTPHRHLLGAQLAGSDDLEWHGYTLLAAYDSEQRVPELRLDYRYDRWQTRWTLGLGRSQRIFEDERGRFLRLRTREVGELLAERPWLHLDRRLTVSLRGAVSREFDRRWRDAPAPGERRVEGGAGLLWSTLQGGPQALAGAHGQRLVGVGEGTYEEGDWNGRLRLGVLLSTPPFLGRQLLRGELTTARTLSGGPPLELGGVSPFAPEAPSVAFGRRRFDLPGHPAGGALGSRLFLARLDWRFPLAEVERGLMLPPVALRRAHGALYLTAGRAWDPGDPAAPWLTAAGAELTLDGYVGFQIPLSLRLGWARGGGPGGLQQAYLRWQAPLP